MSDSQAVDPTSFDPAALGAPAPTVRAPHAPASKAAAPAGLVRDFGEGELLAGIFPLLPTSSSTLLGPGDDAAIISAPDGRVVVSTDVLVEGHHFRMDWSSGYDIGWRAAVQNLADIAAVGARPTALVVAIVIPGHTPVAWLHNLARGLYDACAPWGAGVVGGDLSAGEVVTVAVTVHGDLAGADPVLRSGAQTGDVVAHAGSRGRSAAGLALLTAGLGAGHPGLVAAFLRPQSPLAAGPAAARSGATSMLDVSDGLVRDAARIAEASAVTLEIDEPGDVFAADLAALSEAAAIAGGSARDWVLAGGEDHGMLATFPAGAALPEPFRAIGRVLPRGKNPVEVTGGMPHGSSGWDHFGAN